MWAYVNEKIGKQKRKKNTDVKSLKVDDTDKKITDNEQIANCFNEYFCCIGQNITNKIKSKQSTIDNKKNPINRHLPVSMYLSPTNKIQIRKIIKELNKKQIWGYRRNTRTYN